MHILRQLTKGLLGLLIFFDFGLIYEFWRSGPSTVCGSAKYPCDDLGLIDGPIPYQSVLIALAIQIILVAVLWRSRTAHPR